MFRITVQRWFFLRCFSLSKVWIDPYLYDELHCTFPVTCDCLSRPIFFRWRNIYMDLKLTPLLLLASRYLCAFVVQLLGDTVVVQPFIKFAPSEMCSSTTIVPFPFSRVTNHKFAAVCRSRSSISTSLTWIEFAKDNKDRRCTVVVMQYW
jgi:hypothetical protein